MNKWTKYIRKGDPEAKVQNQEGGELVIQEVSPNCQDDYMQSFEVSKSCSQTAEQQESFHNYNINT